MDAASSVAANAASIAQRASESGNVNLEPGKERAVMDDSAEMRLAREKQSRLEDAAAKEAAQRDIKLAVPTNDAAVKQKLREFGEAATLFGEGPYERRERLKGLIATKGSALLANVGVKADKKEATDNFYTDGSPELHQARLEIAQSSITKASERLRRERKQRENEDVYSYEDRLKRAQANIQKNMYSEVSQVGDSRPLAHCAFSPDPKTTYLATASWSGLVKLWKIPSAEVSHTLRGHEERCNTVAWHPSACSPSAGSVSLASGDAKGLVMLWKTSDEDDSMGETKVEVPVKQLEGHEERINRVIFHPMGKHVISTSHDLTWRLWDIETGKDLLLQEGHVQPVYGVSIHPDGSLVATSDMGGLVRVTDLRSGRCLLPLQGHVKQCVGVDFHPMGHTLATGAEDNQVKIWDLRKRKNIQSLCAHNKLVSSVKFEPEQGRYLLTSSFDNVCRIWSTMDYSCSKALSGHGARVMHADIANSTKYIATVAFDRTFKLWQYAKDDNY
jgi:U4/U6 small nuclear ribonucleoprotein PRP4